MVLGPTENAGGVRQGLGKEMPCNAEPFNRTQRVTNPARQSCPAAASESRMLTGRPALPSVDNECTGRVTEPQKLR